MKNGLVKTYGVGRYIAGERSVEIVRHDYKPDHTKTACLYCHSLGADATAAYNPSWGQDTLEAIAASGLPVLTTDLGGPATWGNDTSVSRLGSAAYYSQVVMGAKGSGVGDAPIVLFAPSMGGLVALNWALANPTLVAGIALLCPVVDLAYEHDQNVNGYAAQIETAYGSAATYATEVAGNDPMQNVAALKATGIPIRVWRASNDTVAVTARQDAYATAVGAEVTDLGAVGHTINPLGTVPDDIASWLRKRVAA